MDGLVARWEANGKKRFVELYVCGSTEDRYYKYKGDGCGGILPAFSSESDAILYMESDSPTGAVGPATSLRRDFPSTKRVV